MDDAVNAGPRQHILIADSTENVPDVLGGEWRVHGRHPVIVTRSRCPALPTRVVRFGVSRSPIQFVTLQTPLRQEPVHMRTELTVVVAFQ